MELTRLLQILEERYPDRAPRDYLSEYELGVLVGNQDVVDHIKATIKSEEKKDIKDK